MYGKTFWIGSINERIKFKEIAKSAKEKNKKKTPKTRLETPFWSLDNNKNKPRKKETIIGKNRAISIKTVF